jgi:hypothetical protein
MTEVAEAPDVHEVHEASKAPDVAKAPEASKAPDVAKAPEDQFPVINSTEFPKEIAKYYKKRSLKDGLITDADIEYFVYQLQIRDFFTKSPERGLAVYHLPGSGKTITFILCAENSPKQVICLIPSTLINNFLRELARLFGSKYDLPKDYNSLGDEAKKVAWKRFVKSVSKKYQIFSLNAPNIGKQLIDVDFDNKIIIVDEAHRLFSSIINVGTINGPVLHDKIYRARNSKVLFLTGSPIVGDVYEAVQMFNLLKGPIYDEINKRQMPLFPESISKFYEYFVDRKTGEIKNPRIFMERITGLVSFHAGAKDENRNIYPEIVSKKIEFVQMSELQWVHYIALREREIDEERRNKYLVGEIVEAPNKKAAKPGFSSFRVKTRQISNFVFPAYLSRPKIITEEIAGQLISQINPLDLTDNLVKYSPKMKYILDAVKTQDGIFFIYSNFVSLEGIGVLARVLKENGFDSLDTIDAAEQALDKPGFRFISLFGGQKESEKETMIAFFNDPRNKDGSRIKIVLASSVIAEGISFKNVRHVILLEPSFTIPRVDQIIARARRIGSHAMLPYEQRTIDVVILASVAPENLDPDMKPEKILGYGEDQTTDLHIMAQAMKHYEPIKNILKLIEAGAFDCTLNWEANKHRVKECFVCNAEKPGLMYLDNLDNHLLNDNCTQELQVFENGKSLDSKPLGSKSSDVKSPDSKSPEESKKDTKSSKSKSKTKKNKK